MLSLYLWLCILSFSVISLNIEEISNPVLYFGNGPQSNQVYYKNCAPKVTCDPNSIYRSIDGLCNNLNNPLWGSSDTPYIRLAEGVYSDGDHAIRKQIDGTQLPGPREVQLELFLYKSRDFPDVYNIHLNQFGQWIAHDITLTFPDLSGPEKCCVVPIDDNTPVQCQAVIRIPDDDPVYGPIGQKCMEFRRARTTTLNFNCTITPQITMNQVTSFIDLSQLYGPKLQKAATLRTFKDGKLLTEIINGHELCPQRQRNESLLCDNRDNVKFCFDGGDPRTNQHFGITLYQTVFTRFHNFLADKFKEMNPKWTDEVLYQEVRRFMIAANQIMVYRDYLPLLLGKEYTRSVGLAFSKHKKTVYEPSLMPQLTVEFAASAFRVPHNILPSEYNFIDENNDVVDSYNLNEWMSISDPLVEKSNFDNLLRGMTQSPGRAPKPSYNYLISNFIFRYFVTGNQDLLSIDIQRGRDVGLPTYNTMRELCGLPRALSFEDLADFLSASDLLILEKLYATVNDVDALVGALLEPPCPGAMVGPTARCIIGDVFYRLRYGDRFFCDVENQPGSFTRKQLKELKKIDLGHIFCAASGIHEVPKNIYKALPQGFSKMRNCEKHLLKLNFSAWRTIPKSSDD